MQYLAHHGIEGQKWGKRNGPPYPLDYSDHSAAEKKQNKGISANKCETIKDRSDHWKAKIIEKEVSMLPKEYVNHYIEKKDRLVLNSDHYKKVFEFYYNSIPIKYITDEYIRLGAASMAIYNPHIYIYDRNEPFNIKKTIEPNNKFAIYKYSKK